MPASMYTVTYMPSLFVYDSCRLVSQLDLKASVLYSPRQA